VASCSQWVASPLPVTLIGGALYNIVNLISTVLVKLGTISTKQCAFNKLVGRTAQPELHGNPTVNNSSKLSTKLYDELIFLVLVQMMTTNS